MLRKKSLGRWGVEFIAHWRGTRAWEMPWQQLQRCGWAWRLGTAGAWSWYQASPPCTLWGPPHTVWHSGEWGQSQGTEPAPSADGKVNYCMASQTSELSQNTARDDTDGGATLVRKARGCYLSGLLQVVMVGGDRCEDRNHGQLNISAGKSLGGLLQALRYQPICHLWPHIKQCRGYLDRLRRYVQSYWRYHAAECGAKMVQAARGGKQQHFILKHPGQFVKNQFQHLPVCLLQEKKQTFWIYWFYNNRRVLYLQEMTKRQQDRFQ